MKKIRKFNYIIYFFGYFVQGLLLVCFNTYLPILLITVLGIPESEIAFAQLLSYLAFFTKPIFALISDKTRKKEGKQINRRFFVFSGSIGLFISFLFMIVSIQLMIIFGIFWSVNYFCMSLIDVAIDGNIIDTSPNVRSKEKKITIIQIGNSAGNITAYILYLILITNINNLNEWNVFLTFQLFSLIPLIAISYFMYEEVVEKEKEKESIKEKSVRKLTDSGIKISYICMAIFLILFYSEALIEIPFEPWLVSRWGQEGFKIYSFLMIFSPFLYIIGYLLKNTVFKYSDRKKILYISLISVGFFDMFIPLMDFWLFIILVSILIIPTAMAYICFVSIMMEFAGDKYSFKFQILAAMVIISKLLFGPMGTLLSGFLDINILLVIAGILIISSIIPIFFIKMEFQIK